MRDERRRTREADRRTPQSERGELFDKLDAMYPPAEEGEFIEIDDETRAMLERELEDLDANPDVGYSWEEVLAHIHRKK